MLLAFLEILEKAILPYPGDMTLYNPRFNDQITSQMDIQDNDNCILVDIYEENVNKTFRNDGKSHCRINNSIIGNIHGLFASRSNGNFWKKRA